MDIINEIKLYQKRLKPNLYHDDLIRSNTCEEIMDIIENNIVKETIETNKRRIAKIDEELNELEEEG